MAKTDMPAPSVTSDEAYVLRYILGCRDEAKDSKQNRMDLNRDNYAMYQMRYDFTHKKPGQSTEVLSKTRNATEQIKSFFQQSLADLDDWWRVVPTNGTDGTTMVIRPEEIQKITNYMLNKADYFNHVGLSVQQALLGSLAVSKVHGKMVSKPRFTTKKEGRGRSYAKHVIATEEKTWKLAFGQIRQEDYYPDDTGADEKLYEIEDSLLDLHIVKQLAEGDDAIYDKSVVDKLSPWYGDSDLQGEKRAFETGQNTPIKYRRPRVKITEFWGTIVDENTGDILHENVVCTVANDTYIIRKPTPNPLWHQCSPIAAAAMIEVANTIWGIALMDAGTKHSKTLTEMFNLILDSGMKAVWGVNQIRVDALDDVSQITDGIPWGTSLKVNSSLPPGLKVMEPVITGDIPVQALNVFNLLNQETLTSMMTNDLRMGAQSSRAVKATEVVAAENSITSVFQGMAKNFEQKKIQVELELAWKTIAQNWDVIDKETFISVFGEERGTQLSNIEPQDVFVDTVNGCKFEVFGISLALRRQADFRKYTTLLQVIGSSEVLIEAFMQRYDFAKYLGEIMTALDINKTKIENEDIKAANSMGAAFQNQNPDQAAMAQPGGAPGAGPNMASQVPQAANQPGGDIFSQLFNSPAGSGAGQRLA